MNNFFTKYFILAGLLFSISNLHSQVLLFHHGEVEFYTETVMSDIEAITKTADVKLERQTGNFEATVNIQSFEFEYDAGLSLKDDQDVSERTITLLHASGCGLVITDQGPAQDVNQRTLLLGLVDDMLNRVKRGVAKNISKASIEQASFPHAKGVTTRTTHVDEDGDTQTHYYYVLQCGNRAASVVGFHDQDCSEPYLQIQKTTLESLQEAGLHANKAGAANGSQPIRSGTNRTSGAAGSGR